MWCALGRRLWSGKKSEDIRIFRFALSKIAENLGKFGPGAKAPESAGVVLTDELVGATSRYFALPADGEGPIFEEFVVLESNVQSEGLEAGGADGIVPSGEELRDLMLANSGERDEFRAGRRATSVPGHGVDATENEVFVDGLSQRTLRCLLIVCDT